MKKFMLVAAIASLAIANAGVALAQAAVGEPGLAAFNHPDADILHAGPGAYGYRAEPSNALASVRAVRHVRGHRHSRVQYNPRFVRRISASVIRRLAIVGWRITPSANPSYVLSVRVY
jgi:hypothetical protein